MLALATALASCSKSELEVPEVVTPPDVPEVPMSITPSAGVDASTTPQSRAAIDGTTFPAVANVFGVTAYAGSAAPTDWTKTYINNVNVSNTATPMTFATPQYYPANGDKVFFYGYAPVVASITTIAASAKVAYTITGQEDIMYGVPTTNGIAKGTSQATQAQPAFAFSHKLMKLQFKLVKDATFQATNATVTNITVKEIKTSAKLLLSDGTLSFDDATADKTVNIAPTTNNAINKDAAAGGVTMTDILMIQPAATVKLSIVAGGVTYPDLTVTLSGTGAGTAGMNHLITLTFKQNSIVPTATIQAWGTTGAGAGDMI